MASIRSTNIAITEQELREILDHVERFRNRENNLIPTKIWVTSHCGIDFEIDLELEPNEQEKGEYVNAYPVIDGNNRWDEEENDLPF